MTLAEIIQQLELTPLTRPQDYTQLTPSAGYTSDLLSCVMANAPRQGIWGRCKHTPILWQLLRFWTCVQ